MEQFYSPMFDLSMKQKRYKRQTVGKIIRSIFRRRRRSAVASNSKPSTGTLLTKSERRATSVHCTYFSCNCDSILSVDSAIVTHLLVCSRSNQVPGLKECLFVKPKRESSYSRQRLFCVSPKALRKIHTSARCQMLRVPSGRQGF